MRSGYNALVLPAKNASPTADTCTWLKGLFDRGFTVTALDKHIDLCSVFNWQVGSVYTIFLLTVKDNLENKNRSTVYFKCHVICLYFSLMSFFLDKYSFTGIWLWNIVWEAYKKCLKVHLIRSSLFGRGTSKLWITSARKAF